MKKLLLLAAICISTGLFGQNDRFFGMIDSLVKYQQFERATDLLHQFIDDHPGRYYDHSKAYFLISRNDLFRGDIEAAKVNNQTSLELRERLLTDDIAENYMQEGAIYIQQEDYEKAIRYLEQAKELPLEDPQVRGQINSYFAEVLKAEGKFKEAKAYLDQSLIALQIELGDHHPDVGRTFRELGTLFLAQNKTSEAETYFKKALAINLRTKDTWLLWVLPHPKVISLLQKFHLQS